MRGLPLPQDQSSSPASSPSSIMSRIVDRVKAAPGVMHRRYERLSHRSKMIIWGIATMNIVILLLVLIITPKVIGRWFNEFAVWIRDLGTPGVILCCALVVVSSHPPLFGVSALMTLIGFAYGLWPGLLIGAIAALVGAGGAFLSVRRFFPGVIRANKQWEAFGRVMREKGTVLVCMIRWCPMPWAIGNGLFASIDSVSFPQFMLSSILYLPKLLIPVFIGSRLTSLADPNAPHDSVHTWLNIISIGLSLTFSMTAGIWIYRLTLAQMRKLEGEHGPAADALEGLEEGLLGGRYRDETGGEEEARSLLTINSPRRPAEELGSGSEASSHTARPDALKRRGSSSPDLETDR